MEAAVHTGVVPALASLDIGGNSLRDEGMELMWAQLARYENISRLCLRDNKLTVMNVL